MEKEYKISKLEPEVYQKVKERFGLKIDFPAGLVFACYPYIHVYAGRLPDDVLAHELVHLERQKLIGVDVWWDKYINDEKFRFNEELLAYKAQYKYVLKHYPSKTHFYNLKFYADTFCKIYDFKNVSPFMIMNLIKAK